MEEKKSGRLQSLKLPRDLSLGLAKPKKQYTPNLNAVRNKDKPKDILKKADQKRKERTFQKGGKSNNDSRFVQSTGIFSQGAGENLRPNLHLDRKVSFQEGGSNSNSMRLPTLKKDSWTVNARNEDNSPDELTGYDMDSDDEKMSFQPLSLSTEHLKKVKKEVKKEDGDGCAPPPFDSDFFSEENPAVAIVRLPDSFAGKGLSDDPNCKKLFDYPLSDMLEGQIGKLLIRKSGKLEMQIGRANYDLCPDNSSEAKQQLVTITEDNNSEKYNIAILSDVLNRFIMVPDFDSLLKKK